ncbi:DMT family transporter [Nocardia sp. NPDC057668]|uniref:DMT family transporter n=1 Tax=Nocardia sp. NPDC057668 TaxID=3346202 RepID=UPI003670958A
MQLPVGAVICAFIAALLFAVSAVAQQRAAAAVPEGEGLLRTLVRNPRWWAGIIGDGGGFAFQVAALALGSVLVVQPILVTSLVFALPLAQRFGAVRVTPLMWANAFALTAALAVFLIVGDPAEGVSDAPTRQWAGPLGVILGLVVAAVIAARVVQAAAWQSLLYGTAGGTLVGVSAALTAHVTDLFEHSLASAVTSWQLYLLVATGLAGVYLQQLGYQAGSLAACLPAFTVAEPIVAAFLGFTVLEERLRSGPLGTVFVIAAVAIMCVAAVALSRAQAGAESTMPAPPAQ